jgi:hypothetical protein
MCVSASIIFLPCMARELGSHVDAAMMCHRVSASPILSTIASICIILQRSFNIAHHDARCNIKKQVRLIVSDLYLR